MRECMKKLRLNESVNYVKHLKYCYLLLIHLLGNVIDFMMIHCIYNY